MGVAVLKIRIGTKQKKTFSKSTHAQGLSEHKRNTNSDGNVILNSFN